MKTFSTSCLILFIALFTAAHLTFAAEGRPEISVETADPYCIPDRSVTIRASMEYQYGPWAWYPVGRWDICVNDGGTSEIIVRFKNEPYLAVISINGTPAELSAPAGKGWAFAFTRQDFVGDRPSGAPRKSTFVLSEGRSFLFKLGGHYRLQEQNLRFKISY